MKIEIFTKKLLNYLIVYTFLLAISFAILNFLPPLLFLLVSVFLSFWAGIFSSDVTCSVCPKQDSLCLALLALILPGETGMGERFPAVESPSGLITN